MCAHQSTEPLFRQQALAALAERNYGRPIARFPKLWSLLAAMLVILVIITGAFLVTATFARKERVVGWLAPDQGLVRITSGRQAQVERIFVGEGDQVAKGDRLLILSLDSDLTDGGKATDAIIAELDREARETGVQIELVQNQLDIDQQTISTSIKELTAERKHLSKQIIVQREREEIAQRLLQRFTELAKEDAASPLEVGRQQAEAAAQTQARLALMQRLAAMDREVSTLRSSLQQAAFESEKALSDLRVPIKRLTTKD